MGFSKEVAHPREPHFQGLIPLRAHCDGLTKYPSYTVCPPADKLQRLRGPETFCDHTASKRGAAFFWPWSRFTAPRYFLVLKIFILPF